MSTFTLKRILDSVSKFRLFFFDYVLASIINANSLFFLGDLIYVTLYSKLGPELLIKGFSVIGFLGVVSANS